MAKYTTEEIRAFKLKDIMNCRQSALKAAATIYESTGCDLGHPVDTVLADADKYFKWLRQDQDVDTKPEPSIGLGNTPGATLGQLPEPTLAQKKVLDAISEKAFDGTMTIAIKAKVLDWAEKVYGQRNYPTKVSSVDLFMKWLELQN